MSRVFINENEIYAFLSNFQIEEEKIQKWINSNLKNYILKKLDTRSVKEVFEISIPYDFSKKVLKALEHKESIYEFKATPQFKRKVEHAIDYLKSNTAPKQVSRLTVEDCFRHSDKWVEDLNKNIIINNKEDDINIVHNFPNDYKIVRLTKKEEFEREGKLMNHCVSDYYKDRYTTGNINQIWSVRNNNNKPLSTIEVRIPSTTNRIEVIQFKGRHNRGMIDPKIAILLKEYVYNTYSSVVWNDEGAFGPNVYDENIKKNIPLALFENGMIKGNLRLADLEIAYLPETLHVKGNLNIEGTPITYIGENMIIEGNIYCERSMLAVIHPNAKIGGEIYVGNSKNMLMSYPENVKIYYC